ncbi:MAG: glycerol-3-phosphate acyltransferase [bacterium]|nr:glycerol-3-phosphate acyltransferase [bacterium]
MNLPFGLKLALALISSYLIGSFPSGYLFFKAKTGSDIRERGSRKNIGATNAFLEGGFRVGFLTFLSDLLKGLLPVILSSLLFRESGIEREVVMVTCGLSAVLGHIFPLYIGFKGGTGLSTSAGAVIGIAPGIALPSILIIIFLTFITKRPAFMVLILTLILPFYSYYDDRSMLITGMMSVVAIIYFIISMTHIKPMLRGDEYIEFSSKLKSSFKKK